MRICISNGLLKKIHFTSAHMPFRAEKNWHKRKAQFKYITLSLFLSLPRFSRTVVVVPKNGWSNCPLLFNKSHFKIVWIVRLTDNFCNYQKSYASLQWLLLLVNEFWKKTRTTEHDSIWINATIQLKCTLICNGISQFKPFQEMKYCSSIMHWKFPLLWMKKQIFYSWKLR
jgi:hypothetical protein